MVGQNKNQNQETPKKKQRPHELYIVDKIIGNGSYGSTFRVTHKDTKEVFCKKCVVVLAQENIGKVIEEGRILNTMNHLNIVKYHNSFFENGKYVLIMEYADNGDLFQKIENRKRLQQPFTDYEIMFLFSQLVIALDYLHSMNIIHRDIKPKNILLGRGDDNLLKLADFGVSKLMTETEMYTNTTAGTPQYVSPEICQRLSYTNKTDIWSLGVVLYELMTLSLPFDGRKETVMKNIQVETNIFKAVNHSNEELSSLLFKLLNRDPSKRFSTKEILNQIFIREFIDNHMVEYYKKFNFNIEGVYRTVSKKFLTPDIQLSKKESDKLEHDFILVKLQEMQDRMKYVQENHIDKEKILLAQQLAAKQAIKPMDITNQDEMNLNILTKISKQLNFNLEEYRYDSLGMLIELVRSKLDGKDKKHYGKCVNYLNNKQKVFLTENIKFRDQDQKQQEVNDVVKQEQQQQLQQ